MPVECPVCQWPATLDEAGPADDPTILLTGVARMGSSDIQIIAIRVDPSLRRTPDYRRDVAEDKYEESGLGAMLETILEEVEVITSEIEEYVWECQTNTVEFKSGSYMVCVVPAVSGS